MLTGLDDIVEGMFVGMPLSCWCLDKGDWDGMI